MNVTVQELAPCKKLMRVEVEAAAVNAAFESVTKDFQKQAVFAGFRPGRAPEAMVVRKYAKDIEEEAKRKLISDSYRKAVDEQKLDVLGRPEIEEIQFKQNEPLQFAATIETAPEFQLPEYRGLKVKREARVVSEADVNGALEALRAQRADFKTTDRAAQTGDVLVVNYTGTCEGKPITDLAPTAAGLAEKKNFWVNIPSPDFIAGFGEQLVGEKAGGRRTVTVDFPADFVTPQLSGKKGVFEVEVLEVKEKVLPTLDEAFAKAFGAESLEKLTAGVRKDLENELAYSQKRNIRDQIIRALASGVNFDLPESSVTNETRNVVYQVVKENARRGVSRELIEEHKEKIYSAATQGARERVKIAFLLQRIAEREDLKVSEAELAQRIHQMAHMYQIPAEKLARDLKAKDGLLEVFDQILNEKVLALLETNAVIEDVAPAPTVASPS